MPDFSLSIALEKKILPAVTFDNEENVLPVAETFLKAGLGGMPGDLMMQSNLWRFFSQPVPVCIQHSSWIFVCSLLSAIVTSKLSTYKFSAANVACPSRPKPRMQIFLPLRSRMVMIVRMQWREEIPMESRGHRTM